MQCGHGVPSKCTNNSPFSPAYEDRCRNSVPYLSLFKEQLLGRKEEKAESRNHCGGVSEGGEYIDSPEQGPQCGGALLEKCCYPKGLSQHGDALRREKQKGRVKGLLFCEYFVTAAPAWSFI